MKHLRTRVFFQILIPVLIMYLLVIFGGIRYMGQNFHSAVLTQKQTTLSNIVRGIDDWLLFRISEVVQLSRIPLFKQKDEAAIRKYIREWQYTYAFNYDYLYLIQPDGSYYASDSRRGFVQDSDFLNKFIEDEALFVYAGPHRFGSILSGHFVIGVPVYSDSGELQYILAATVTRENLQKLFGYYAFEDFDSWMMVNAQSTIIAHNNTSLVGKNETEVYGNNILYDEERESEQVFVQIMRTGWKVVTFISRDRLMKPFSQVNQLIFIFSVFLIVFLVMLVSILSAAVAQPVRRLTAGVYRIMAGDYSQRIHINTHDEISELAESFNRLASRMQSRRTEDRFIFLGHIAARMAHELRKPLHVIQLASQSMELPAGERYREIIDQEISNADRFISEVLNFAQDDELNREFYSLNALLNIIIAKFQLLADEVDVKLESDISDSVPEYYIDVIRMEEVISNLLQNSLDSISENRGSIYSRIIRLRLFCVRDQHIELEIEDSGPGFKEELMDRYFDPYFTTRKAGTGLGLSLCYRILMAHGCNIKLENTRDQHARVVVEFPL